MHEDNENRFGVFLTHELKPSYIEKYEWKSFDFLEDMFMVEKYFFLSIFEII